MPHKKAPVTRAKARTILREGKIGGKKLSPGQRGLFGSIAGGSFGHPKRGKLK